MAIRQLKFLERGLKRVASAVLRAVSRAQPGSAAPHVTSESRLLFIRLHRIGDALVTTGLLAEVKRQTGARVEVYADARNAFVFRDQPYVDAVHVHRQRLGGYLGFARLTRQHAYDAIVDTHPKPSSTVAWLVALGRTAAKVGFDRPEGKGRDAYTVHVPRPTPDTAHVVDRLRSLSAALGLDPGAGDWNVQYHLPPAAQAVAADFLATAVPGSGPVVGINPFSSSAVRFWGAERLRRLVDWLQARGARVVVLAPPAQAAEARSFCGSAAVYAEASFAAYAAMIARLQLLFTPDTSAVHLASAFRVPVFAYYTVGTGVPDMAPWTAYGAPHAEILWPHDDVSGLEFEPLLEVFAPFAAPYLAAPTPAADAQ